MRVALATMALVLTSSMALAQVPTLTPSAAPPEMKDINQKVSYIFGLSMAEQLKQDGISVDIDLVSRGLRDGLSGAKPLMSEEEIQAVMVAFEQQMAAQQQKQAAEAAAKSKQEGAAFMAENAKKPGVTTLPSGLQYEVLQNGNGPTPTATSTVSAHYEGKLLNGTVFDSSYRRGEPLAIPVNRVIKGWTEALQLMKVGDKWRLYIPSDLAYGDTGSGGVIPPGATLVFEVELLGIQ